MAKAKTTDKVIELERLQQATIEIPIRGLTPYIPHNWSEKAKRLMPGHPDAGKTKKAKSDRDPEAEAEACLYKLGEELAAPAIAFKAAMVDACRFFKDPSMVEARQILRVEGEGDRQLVRIQVGEMVLHEDTPRNANGNADLRYRYYLSGWYCAIRVNYLPSRISRESVIALADAAGRGGIGDWRPSAPKSKTGTYGTWQVDSDREVRDV